MELRHLRYFDAVAETLSFSRAAERLRVAQPALSRQIRDLEHELGVQLFDRNRVRVRLTDAGRVFQTHVQKLLAQVAVAITSAQSAAQGADGELVVCNDWRLAVKLIPQTVMAFRERYPQVTLTLRELPLHEQLPALRSKRIHLGFLPRVFMGVRDDLEMLTIIRSEVVAVVAATHRFAQRAAVKLRELKAEPWVVLNEKVAPGHRAQMAQQSRLAGFTPIVAKTAASLEGLLVLVETGSGTCLVPRFVLPPERDTLRYLRTDCAPFELCAVWLRRASSRLLENYLAIMRDQLARETERGASAPTVSTSRPRTNSRATTTVTVSS